MVGGVPKFDYIGVFMRDTLHRFPVWQRILYRLSSIVRRCVLGIAPAYLLELFILTSAALADNLCVLPPEAILWYFIIA